MMMINKLPQDFLPSTQFKIFSRI